VGKVIALQGKVELKDLSVNRCYLPPTDDSSGQMNQRLIAFGQFLIPHQELAEPIEPGVDRFHHPAPVLGGTPWLALLVPNPGEIPMSGKDRLGRFPLIAPVGI
jgi:hypothetical protein